MRWCGKGIERREVHAASQTVGAALAALAMLAAATAQAADLTALEQRWLQGAAPVLAQARAEGLPVDIVVQPQPSAGTVPLGLAWIDGRCKLVLSMRGNPEAQATLDRLPRGHEAPALELIAAHELLGHCRRRTDGAWQSLPPGTDERPPEGLSTDTQAAWARMQATRREEAWADLAALAWVRQRHAAAYPVVLAWLLHERSRDLVPGSHHDTLAWLQAASTPSADILLATQPPAVAAQAIWQAVVQQGVGPD